VLKASAEGFPFEFCNGGGLKKTRMKPVAESQKKFDDMSIRLRVDTMLQDWTDGRTDTRTDLLKQYRALHAQHADAR